MKYQINKTNGKLQDLNGYSVTRSTKSSAEKLVAKLQADYCWNLRSVCESSVYYFYAN
jgi:molybdate-binding protein